MQRGARNRMLKDRRAGRKGDFQSLLGEEEPVVDRESEMGAVHLGGASLREDRAM